jgi:hypothetical protein
MSVQCPLSGVKQKSRHKTATTAYDPIRTSERATTDATETGAELLAYDMMNGA